MNLNEQLRQAYNAGRRQGLNEQMPGYPGQGAGDGGSIKPMYQSPGHGGRGGGYLQSPYTPADQVDYDNPPDTYYEPPQQMTPTDRGNWEKFKERQRRRKRYYQPYIPFPGFGF